jgi:hypothetical protein
MTRMFSGLQDFFPIYMTIQICRSATSPNYGIFHHTSSSNVRLGLTPTFGPSLVLTTLHSVSSVVSTSRLLDLLSCVLPYDQRSRSTLDFETLERSNSSSLYSPRVSILWIFYDMTMCVLVMDHPDELWGFGTSGVLHS